MLSILYELESSSLKFTGFAPAADLLQICFDCSDVFSYRAHDIYESKHPCYGYVLILIDVVDFHSMLLNVCDVL